MRNHYFRTALLQLLLPVIIGMLLPATLMAQTGKEKIEAQKVAFITKELKLTVSEAQAFWPLYNDYLQKKENLRQAFLKTRKKDLEAITDKEAETMMEEELAYKQKEVDLQRDFTKKMRAVIPARKAVRLYKAEEDFKLWLIEQLKKQGNK